MLQRPDDARLPPLPLLALAFGLYMVLILVAVFWIFPSGMLRPVSRATAGLVNATLVLNLGMLAVVAGLLLCRVAGMRGIDLGLEARHIPAAVGWTLATWILVNVGVAAWQFLREGAITYNPDWRERGASVVVGGLLAQYLGNALYEEIMFRGLLLRQLFWRLEGRTGPDLERFVIALVISQAWFAALHLPLYLSQGMPLAQALTILPNVLLAGAAFSILYVRTGNLLLAVGIHAFVNEPALVVADPFGYDNLYFVVAVCAVIVWIWPMYARLRGRWRSRSPGGALAS